LPEYGLMYTICTPYIRHSNASDSRAALACTHRRHPGPKLPERTSFRFLGPTSQILAPNGFLL
jgi:hypothetical protein